MIPNESKRLLYEIDTYVNKIKCDKFLRKGSLDDYKTLFQKVFEYSDEIECNRLNLEYDMKKLSNFAEVAEKLTENIECLTSKIKSIIEVNDIHFLTNFRNKVQKISKLYDTIEEFQTTVVKSSDLYIPKTLETVNSQLSRISKEIDKTMIYLDNFSGVVHSDLIPENAHISNDTKNKINKTCDYLDNRKDPSYKYIILIIYILLCIIVLLIAYIYKYKYIMEIFMLIIMSLLFMTLLIV